MLVPITFAVLGIFSSCPRVMTMQCWKPPITSPPSTRHRVIFIVIIVFPHNVCRTGYPFFLSPSDDVAMLASSVVLSGAYRNADSQNGFGVFSRRISRKTRMHLFGLFLAFKKVINFRFRFCFSITGQYMY